MEIDPPEEITSVVVTGDIPSTPQVLADESFVRQIRDAEKLVGEIVIATPQHLALSATLFNDLTKSATKLEQARVTLKAPFIEYGRRIDAVAAVVADQIKEIKSDLNAKMRAFQIEQDRIAREAEQKRLAELRRLEDQRRAEEAERKRLADEEAARVRAAAPKIQEMELDLPAAAPTPIEEKIAAVQAAPAIVAPKPQGVRYDVTLKFEVTDVRALPFDYMIPTANLSKIRGLTAGWREGQAIPALPGVRFFEDRQFRGTGR